MTMDNLESVELDCLSKSDQSGNSEGRHRGKMLSNRTHENDDNMKEEKSTMRNILESFNINGLVSTINYEDHGKKNVGLNQEKKEQTHAFGREEKGKTIGTTNVNIHNRNNLTESCQKYGMKERNFNLLGSQESSEKSMLFDNTSIDLDNETKNLEEWDETQKKIYDPTVGLRKHYTSELLSCGEKNDIRILEKWSSMINRDIAWFVKNHKTTYLRRVKRGIPQKYRWKIWLQITNAKQLISKFQKKYYFLSKKKSTYTNLILIDISRTFPELLIFDKYAQQQLYRILNAYSNYDPSVGYCQGMNFVVGLLLLVSNFDELETFCVLVSLMNNYHLKEFYKENFPLLNKYIYVFEKILQSEVPDLVEHFNKEEVLPPVYLHQWMLTLFIASLPIKSVIVIWDFLFSTSIKMIIFIAVALLKILKIYLIKHKFEKILKLLKSLKYNESNDDILIAKLLIKKSDAIYLNDELKFIFENIENDNILFNRQCKYAIENISNYHFSGIQNNKNTNLEKKNEDNRGIKKLDGNETEEYNFVHLDEVPILNYFANNLLKKKSEKELKLTSILKHNNVDRSDSLKIDGNIGEYFGQKKRPSDLNSLYYKIVNEKKTEKGKRKEEEKEEEEKEEEEEEEKEEEEEEGGTKKIKKNNHCDMNSDANDSNASEHFFFGNKSMTVEKNIFENKSDGIHLNKRLGRLNDSNDNNERMNIIVRTNENDVYAKDSKQYTDDFFISPSTEENLHEEDSPKFLYLKKKKKLQNENTNIYNNNGLYDSNYLSENSCNLENITRSSFQLKNDDVIDHLYKSDSFVEAYQKGNKKKEYDDINYDFNDNYYNENYNDVESGDDEKHKSLRKSNICNEKDRKKKKLMYKTRTSKSLSVNVDMLQRNGSNQKYKHADHNGSPNKQDSHDEEKRSEYIIKTRMSKYENKLNAKEKLEKSKYQDMTRKMKKEREKKEREEKERQEKERQEKEKDEYLSVLNISQYIQSDENEQKSNDNNLGFFNIIQSYTKDNNWFDVSTINKYYNFNKNNMDYELDDINYSNNKNQRKNEKRDDDDGDE